MTSDIQPLESSVAQLYRHRFPDDIRARRIAVWEVLCRQWLSRYVPMDGRVLEAAAGDCEFINSISAAERVAIDLNPESSDFAAEGVVFHQGAAESLDRVLEHESFDSVFMSNFLEHCRTRDQILAVLRACHRVLRPGGRLLILGPNFRYCYRDYYDFFDHHITLTDRAVVEGLRLVRFRIEEVHPRTLPFSFRSRYPAWLVFVRAYLSLPWLWRLFGSQFFIVARKAA